MTHPKISPFAVSLKNESMKNYISEAISTFFLVLIGTGSVIVDSSTGGQITLAGISVITGVIVALMILMFGSVSGAHMNPAVTIALAWNGTIDKREIPPYMLAQAIGAFAGSFMLNIIFSKSHTLGETIPSVNIFLAFLIEVVLTMFLMLVILTVSGKKIFQAAWIIGAAVALGIFAGGNYSGGSMNPIRSLAPAVLNDNLNSLWIFLTAPFIGALFGLAIYKKIKK